MRTEILKKISIMHQKVKKLQSFDFETKNSDSFVLSSWFLTFERILKRKNSVTPREKPF